LAPYLFNCIWYRNCFIKLFIEQIALKSVKVFCKRTKYCSAKSKLFSWSICQLKTSFVIQQQILNLTNQCSLSMTVRHIFEISEDDHPSLVTGARAHWWTLDLANASLSPGVNSRGELVPSHGASRRRLGDYR
jgi:hypothetical protein